MTVYVANNKKIKKLIINEKEMEKWKNQTALKIENVMQIMNITFLNKLKLRFVKFSLSIIIL